MPINVVPIAGRLPNSAFVESISLHFNACEVKLVIADKINATTGIIINVSVVVDILDVLKINIHMYIIIITIPHPIPAYIELILVSGLGITN